MTTTLICLAGMTAGMGAPARAVRLASAAETIRVAIQFMPEPTVKRIYDETLASARAALGEAAFAQAWTAGQRMTLEEALAFALAPASDVISE